MRLIIRQFWHCCRLPFLGSVMTKDWVLRAVGRSFGPVLEGIKTLPLSTSLPVLGEIAGVNTSLGGYLHSSKTRARWAEGIHDELNGHVFDLERDGLRQFAPCP